MKNKIFICITDWPTFYTLIKYNCWGVKNNFAKQLSNAKKNDILLFYIKQGKYKGYKKDSSIFGIFKFDKNVDNQIMELAEYPNKMTFKKFINVDKPKQFKPLVNNLSFIKNKQYWGLSFMGRAMVEIQDSDYEIIRNYLENVN